MEQFLDRFRVAAVEKKAAAQEKVSFAGVRVGGDGFAVVIGGGRVIGVGLFHEKTSEDVGLPEGGVDGNGFAKNFEGFGFAQERFQDFGVIEAGERSAGIGF